jgi:hypothetical protein
VKNGEVVVHLTLVTLRARRMLGDRFAAINSTAVVPCVYDR